MTKIKDFLRIKSARFLWVAQCVEARAAKNKKAWLHMPNNEHDDEVSDTTAAQ
ncbi:hypothetical protein I5907_09490 [Panacibacter sp. DH6]|uniref:Uncharacterized protein n=1 Tax=Panacibacter microcysteis TaxID=2793269 RepID=A0A931GVJ9_9BACT|nr:hypothetical protein [Panacibacter microcysteis]MBG9376465.1 hypothetical protein [Panacibacter microcysteis]